MSKELMIIMTGLVPEEALIEMLEDEIAKYKMNPNKENFKKIGSIGGMIMLKSTMDGSPESIIKTLDDVNIMDKGINLLKPNKD